MAVIQQFSKPGQAAPAPGAEPAGADFPRITPKATAPSIGIFAHVGNGNLGDEANMTAIIQNIRLRYPSARILAFSHQPDDTEQRHYIPAYPIRRMPAARRTEICTASEGADKRNRGLKVALKSMPGVGRAGHALMNLLRTIAAVPGEIAFLRTAAECVAKLDLLIIAGGGQLGDYFGGPWGYPFTVFKWCALAKLAGKKLVFLSVGAGPLNSAVSRFFVRTALRLSDYRSFRDESSRDLIDEIGAKGDNYVFPDPVHSIALPPVLRPPGSGRDSLVVGINPLPYFDALYWAEHNETIYRGYVEVMAGFARWLIERGHRVCLFPTQLRADPQVVEHVREALIAAGGATVVNSIVERQVDGFETLLAAIAGMDVVVASRFHGIIIPLQLEKPVLGISYYQKTNDLMRDMGMGEYVLDIDGLQLNSLIEKFQLLVDNLEPVRSKIVPRKLAYRSQLAAQYDRVLSLLPRASSAEKVGAE